MNTFDFKELERKLMLLYGKINTIEEIEKHRGSKFNIFSILKMERKEVSTHSYFIYELINPHGSHFQGSKYLKIFVNEVLNIDDFDFANVKVGMETLTDSLNNSNRRIDFTIENDKYYIAIEMKIDADDQDEQLADYLKHAKNQNKEPHVYYLTLDGKEASEKSHKGIEYKRVSFINDISSFIEQSIEKSAELTIIRESLIQYKYLIEKITNQTTQEIQMEVSKIVDNPEMAKAANEMSKSLNYIWALKEAEFWKKLLIKLENNNLKSKGWNIFSELSKDDEDYGVEDKKVDEYISELGKKDIRGIYLEKNNIWLGVYCYSEGFEYRVGCKEKNKLEIVSDATGINGVYSEDEKYTVSKYGYSFSNNCSNPTYDIFDSKKLDIIIENMFEEVIDYLKRADKVIE